MLHRGGVTAEDESTGGVTTLMVRAALRGTARRDATRLAEDAEYLGGTPAASVGTETFQWTLGVPARSFDGASELLADIVLEPRFPGGRRRGRARRGHRRAGHAARRHVSPAHAARGRGGVARTSVRPLDARHRGVGDGPHGRAARWHAARVPESAVVLAAVGDLDPAAAADVLARRFAALRAAAPVPVEPPVWTTSFREARGPRPRTDRALALLRGAGARRPGALRRRDAGRGGERARRAVLRGAARPAVAGVHGDRAAVRARAGRDVRGVHRHLTGQGGDRARRSPARVRPLREEEVTAEELDRARTYAIGAWQIRQSSGAAVLSELADAWLHGSLADLARYPQDLAAVTPTRMHAAARRWFVPERRVEGVVRGRRR
jgi:hypothetical protein